MSFGNVNNDYNYSILGSQSYSGAAAASMGGSSKTTGGTSFDEALKSSVGFGARGESGGVTESIAAASTASQDLISQLQYSLLKNDGTGGLDNRLSNALF